MMPIASAVSAAQPLSGQENRSSNNIQLLSSNGSSITISGPAGEIKFDIAEDVGHGGNDPTLATQVNAGDVIPGGVLKVGVDYYIANPKNANENFVIILNQ